MNKLPLPEAMLWQGCGDSSCIVRVQRGQHTNGGCRCHSQPIPSNVRKAFQQLYQDREYFRNLASKAAPEGKEGGPLAGLGGAPRRPVPDLDGYYWYRMSPKHSWSLTHRQDWATLHESRKDHYAKWEWHGPIPEPTATRRGAPEAPAEGSNPLPVSSELPQPPAPAEGERP